MDLRRLIGDYMSTRVAQSGQMTRGPFHAPGGIDQAAGGATGLLGAMSMPGDQAGAVAQGLKRLVGSAPVTGYRGMTSPPIEGVQSGRFPGLTFFSENPSVAGLYAEGAGGNMIRESLQPHSVLDLSSVGSLEGSSAIRDAIGHALNQPITFDAELAPALQRSGYDAVKVLEHILGRHTSAPTWIMVSPP